MGFLKEQVGLQNRKNVILEKEKSNKIIVKNGSKTPYVFNTFELYGYTGGPLKLKSRRFRGLHLFTKNIAQVFLGYTYVNSHKNRLIYSPDLKKSLYIIKDLFKKQN